MCFCYNRDGRQERVHFDKITSRIKKLCYGLDDEYVDAVTVAQKVCQGVYKGVTTIELDELAAETAAQLTTMHPGYGILAARICISNLHKETLKSFSETCSILYNYVELKTGRRTPLLSDECYNFVQENAEALNAALIYDRDFEYDYFGFKTLERSYLLRVHGRIVERPQHMLMRVACGIHNGDLQATIETYNLMSLKWFTHASPTLFNAGTPTPQLSSCFLLSMTEDSIEGIYDTLKRCAQISKSAGGIGLSVSNIRASGSYIAGTNGFSNGLTPMLRVFNNTARYVDQGGGKRKGAFAVYLEPWHADIFAWLDLRKNHGAEELRARDLFYGLWVPDLFMKRVESNGQWSLFCPNVAKGLQDAVGDEFERLYVSYEQAGKAHETIRARALWQAILEAQTETGNPYMMYKDACNLKSNQQNLGTIHCSNLCTEIVEYTSPDEVAVCNLASIALPRFVTKRGRERSYDFQKLYDIVKVVTKNLNRIIDVNFYPIKEAKNSNMRHRPVGLGVQGLADTFILMRHPFESKEAQQLNKDIFETIYFAALTSSMEQAKIDGPYSSYEGSPASKGQLQFDLWGVTEHSGRWDWAALKAEIKQHGLRNSLLVAPMPTASTSQILGNNECIEPYTSNLYVRRTLAGEFVCVSKHLLTDLIKLNLWDENMKNKLMAHNGSVQNIREIPAHIRQLYKTVWEMKGKTLIDMAADRGCYVDQSQSFNVHMSDINFGKLTSMHFYAWKRGLKTGMYYLRSQAAVDAKKVTVDQSVVVEAASSTEAKAKVTVASKETTPSGTPLGTPNAKKSPYGLTRAKVATPDPTAIAAARTLSTDFERSREDIQAEEKARLERWRAEREQQKAALECSLDNPDECLMCGS